ncbi:MAG: hypothetical protein BWY11_01251 [Firmicutes bacterium ADurb.Bin182]|nr:MAG: hypothetical protein BWY11_01251 [Firmicutes bacterium ADurb.Bin182]
MTNSKAGNQTIGCSVTSCRYNKDGNMCELNRIEVEPAVDVNTGEPADESLCGSYRKR